MNTAPGLERPTPRRVQLKRTRGWRIPADTVIVDRRTRWGNPFTVHPGRDAAEAVRLYRAWLRGYVAVARRQRPDLAPLRGRNLACWCTLDAPCHADVLLELANSGAET